jgi:hypothetical protein
MKNPYLKLIRELHLENTLCMFVKVIMLSGMHSEMGICFVLKIV